jgi:hypothetical protein
MKICTTLSDLIPLIVAIVAASVGFGFMIGASFILVFYDANKNNSIEALNDYNEE